MKEPTSSEPVSPPVSLAGTSRWTVEAGRTPRIEQQSPSNL